MLALSTYVTMRRLSRSDIQYWRYLHMFEWEDSVHHIYNTDPIYICFHDKTQSIRYSIPTLSTYVTKRRVSRSDIQYRLYLHMLPREDSVDQIYNTDTIYIYYPWEDSANQIYNTDPIYISYHEKTQSIRYTINALSTYITMRRLSRSGIQYRPYLNKLPWEDSVDQLYNYRPHLHTLPCEDSVNQIYNTDPIYICYHEKTQSIRYTTPTLSIYVTERRLSGSDIQYRPFLHMLLRDDSAEQMYNTDHINIWYREKTQSIR